MRKPEKMLVYNLFPLLAGKFARWEPHIRRASEMGFNWLFVNPVQEPGMSGSLYSIKDYFGLNPVLVDGQSGVPAEEQLKGAISSAGSLGMRAMVDLVVNHCAVDSALIKEHPAWFEWEKKGKVAHPFADEDGRKVVWGDLAKFNHRHSKDKEGLYQYFLEVVDYLVGLGFAGFRCDAAYQLPRSFWQRLIRDTRQKHPEVLFFAETLGCTAAETKKTAAAGFDYIFNSSKWWDFEKPWLMEQYNMTRETAPSIGFPESHDTERLAEETGGNVNALKQRYFFAALFSAGVMIAMGFEFGFRKKPHVVETRPEDWEETDIDLREYIKKVNGIKSGHAVFQEECPTEIWSADNPRVLVMKKKSRSSPERALLVLNKDARGEQHFNSHSLRDLIRSDSPLKDVSPEYPLPEIREPFHYGLRPGQGIVVVTGDRHAGHSR
jgi:starch synthase (maltosyl-transferring)